MGAPEQQTGAAFVEKRNSEILTITARFRDNAVAHLRAINWRAVAVLAADRRSFTMTIPISSQSGAERLRA